MSKQINKSTTTLVKVSKPIHHDLKIVAAYEDTLLQTIVNDVLEAFVLIKKRQYPNLKLTINSQTDKSLYRPELEKYRDDTRIESYEKELGLK